METTEWFEREPSNRPALRTFRIQHEMDVRVTHVAVQHCLSCWPLPRSGGCGSLFRYPEWADIEPLVVAIRSQGDRYRHDDESRATTHHTIADRIETVCSCLPCSLLACF